MKSRKGKADWDAVSGIAKIATVIVAVLVFLFGDGLFRNQARTALPTGSASTAMRVSTAVLTSTPAPTITANPLYTPNSTPITMNINKPVLPGNKGLIFTLNYIRLNSDRLLLDFTLANNNPINVFTCGLPRVAKTDYGTLSPILEQGGFYVNIHEPKNCFFGREALSGANETHDGWLVYQVEPTRFQISGMYTVYNLGTYLPILTFEIAQ